MYIKHINVLVIFLSWLIVGCNANKRNVRVEGHVTYATDGLPLAKTFVTRHSDDKTFMTDSAGMFRLNASEGDSLTFMYVGTVSRTLPVVKTYMDVVMQPYLPEVDEYIFVDSIRKLEVALNEYVRSKEARIGVAVIIDGRDTVMINGNRDFPMMSVFKFPLSLAVAEWIDLNNSSLADSVFFGPECLRKNTYSPMLKKYGEELDGMSVRELLQWALTESDNNATDILLNHIGGIESLNSVMRGISVPDAIHVGASEEDMDNNPYLSYLNRSTPLAMAVLFDFFNREGRYKSSGNEEIALMLENCRTGLDRLCAPLPSSGVTVGHKTGTGFRTPEGGISALNDCGYINLPDGHHYSISVFVADSPYDIDLTSKIIADISALVYAAVKTDGPE